MKVFISATLRSFAGHNSVVVLQGESIRDVLKNLTEEYPDIRKVLFDEDGRIRSFVNVYVNRDNMDAHQGLETRISETDELFLLPVIAGGLPGESVISDERRKEMTLDEKETVPGASAAPVPAEKTKQTGDCCMIFDKRSSMLELALTGS